MNTRKSNVQSVLQSMIYVLGAVMGLGIIAVLFGLSKFTIYVPMRRLLIVALLLCGLIALLLNRVRVPWPQKSRLKSIFYTVNLCVLALQFAVAYGIYQDFGWDVGMMLKTASQMVNGEPWAIWYYATYPNNYLLTRIFAWICKAAAEAGIQNWSFILVCINVVFLNVCGVMTVRMALDLTKSKGAALLAWVIYTFCCSFSPYMAIPYSDTWALLATTTMLFLYSKILSHNRWYYWLGIGLACIIGTLIKPTCAIALIAIVITELVCHGRRPLFALITSLTTCILLTLCNQLLLKNLESEGADLEMRRTYVHYLMMGLNEGTYGLYSPEDNDFSDSFPTVKEREAASWKVIAERIRTPIQERGIWGLVRQFSKKLNVNYEDGTGGWRSAHSIILLHTGPLRDLFGSLYCNAPAKALSEFKGFDYHMLLRQVLWLIILIAIPMTGFHVRRNASPLFLALLLCFIGITMFTMLFEAKTRYLFLYQPAYILVACRGLQLFPLRIGKTAGEPANIH